MEEIRLNQLIGGLSCYLQGSIHPRWLGMGFLNHQQYDVCVQYKLGMCACVYCNIKIHKLHEPPKKTPPTFHYTGCLIGILIIAYYNPYITGQHNPLYTLTNHGIFRGSHASQVYHSKYHSQTSSEFEDTTNFNLLQSPKAMHGTNGIVTYIYHKHQLNVGKYTNPMDPMGTTYLQFRWGIPSLTSHW